MQPLQPMHIEGAKAPPGLAYAEVAEVAEVFRPHATTHYHPHAVVGPSERSNVGDRGGKGMRASLFRSTARTPAEASGGRSASTHT